MTELRTNEGQDARQRSCPDGGSRGVGEVGVMRRLRVYTASKLCEGPRWRRLAEEMPEIEIVARWPFTHVTQDGEPDWPRDCAAHGAEFWRHDHDDVAACDVLLLYGATDHVLRGGLVEAGMALALGKTVIVVGDNPGYGTWQYHQQVRRVRTLQDAHSLLQLMAIGASP